MYKRLFFKLLFVYLSANAILSTACFNTCIAQNRDSVKNAGDFKLSPNSLKETVKYEAEDSVTINLKLKKADLHKKTKVNYDDMRLESDLVSINFYDNTIYARSTSDSNGNPIGKVVFKQGSSTFYSKAILYHFQTKQGIVYNVITNEADGLMHGDIIKKKNDSVAFVKHGIYTTCNLEHPHYGFVFTKAKVIANDVIVTKFIHPEIMGISIPVGLPFSLLPNASHHKNGFLFPSYGESSELGFYLQGLGLYYKFNERLDMIFSADIYLRGSFALNLSTNYYKRYKYKGHFDASYSFTRKGEPKTPTYNIDQDIKINWKHTQDSKAHPRNRFSADVNYQTSSYNKNNITDLNNYVNSNYNSTVSFSTSFGNLQTLGINASLSQNLSTGIMNLNLPNINYNISTFYPLRRKETVGKIRWYENISLSYNLNAFNSVQTFDSLFMTQKMFNNMRYGVTHSIPLTSNIKIFKNINLNNTLRFDENWQFKGACRSYGGKDSLNKSIVLFDTNYGFYATHKLTYSAVLNTTLYGLYQFKDKRQTAIRHQMSPSLNFSYIPFINRNIFKTYLDSNVNKYITYSPIEGFLYGIPADKSSAFLTMSLGNKLEMKTKDKTDTSKFKKIMLLESFNISASYNVMADSLNWIPLSISGRTTLFNKLHISFNAYFDPYVIDENGKRINQLEIEKNGRLFRMSSTAANLSLAYQLSNNTFCKEKVPSNFGGWNMSISYSLNYNIVDNYNYYNVVFLEDKKYNHTLTNTVNISGNLRITNKWEIGFTSGYDFTNKTISASSFRVNRDLHCWSMGFEWHPFGYYRGVEFHINPKAGSLKDLKIPIKKDYRNF